MWASLLTMYIRPTAIPDINSSINNAATSVKPFERSCDFFPMIFSPAPEALTDNGS
jgi:hypothetical protein